MKCLLALVPLVALAGCGGVGAPDPSSYCGQMGNSGHYGLSGRVVLVIGYDRRVLGTLTQGNTKYEIRGDIQESGSFSGVLDGPGDDDYNLSGSITTSRADQAATYWVIDGPGDENDTVNFSIGDC